MTYERATHHTTIIVYSNYEIDDVAAALGKRADKQQHQILDYSVSDNRSQVSPPIIIPVLVAAPDGTLVLHDG
jgi:hypothetical protein